MVTETKTAEKPLLLFISTVAYTPRVMIPHFDAAREAGFRVEIACNLSRFREDLEPHCDALHHVSLQRNPLHPKNIAGLFQLIQIIRVRRPAIVHTLNPTGGFMGRLAATLARVGALRLYTAHGFHFHSSGGRVTNFIYRSVETVAGRLLSDAVMTINKEDYDTALRTGVARPDRIYLTKGVGIPVDEYDPDAAEAAGDRGAIRKEFGIPEGAPVLSMIGEMLPRKRYDDTLTAFSKLLPKHPNAVLILVGDGKSKEALEARARELFGESVAQRVLFPGFRRDVRRILAATDVFLFPSQQEGLPRVIQEALAMRVPVVATAVRGNIDLLDPTCGRLVPLGDTDALAAATAEMLALSPEQRRNMGAAGRAKMKAEFDLPDCIREVLDLYDLIGSRLGTPPLVPSRSPEAQTG